MTGNIRTLDIAIDHPDHGQHFKRTIAELTEIMLEASPVFGPQDKDKRGHYDISILLSPRGNRFFWHILPVEKRDGGVMKFELGGRYLNPLLRDYIKIRHAAIEHAMGKSYALFDQERRIAHNALACHIENLLEKRGLYFLEYPIHRPGRRLSEFMVLYKDFLLPASKRPVAMFGGDF